MPLFMENALNIVPTATSRYCRRRPLRLQPLTANRHGVSSSQDVYKGVPMRPIESRVFAKLYENSHRLVNNVGHQSTKCMQRLPSTPVDVDVASEFHLIYSTSVVEQRGANAWYIPGPTNLCDWSIHIMKAPTCCRHHWELHQEGRRHQIDAVLPYHDAFSPPRPVSVVLQRRVAPDRLVKLVEKDRSNNLRRQLSLPTIIVRWHQFRGKQGHNITSIYNEMRSFGPIDNITMTSPVSARVTFHLLESACRAVAHRFVGSLDSQFLCLWYHYSMASKGFYIRRRHLHVVVDPFISENI